MESSHWLQVLLSQIWSVPYLIAYSVGIGLSLILCRRHPAVSLCAFVGFMILFGAVLTGVGMSIWLSMADHSSDPSDRVRVMQIAGILRSVLSMFAYGFLITAIFGWRKAK